MGSSNITDFVQSGVGSSATSAYPLAGLVRKAEDWWDVNVFGDPLPYVRVGAEFASFMDTYADGYVAKNMRGQLSGWLRF
jgi:hypothetical protein